MNASDKKLAPTQPLAVELRVDPGALPPRLVEALAALVLDRARRRILREGNSPPQSPRDGKEKST
jgi:hypothetical protein